TAANIVADLVRRFAAKPLPHAMLLNVNVPDLPMSQIAGVRVTRLGRRHKAEPVIKSSTPRGDTVDWVGAAGRSQDAGAGTDFHTGASGAVSITHLQTDPTHSRQLHALGDWLNQHTVAPAEATGH